MRMNKFRSIALGMMALMGIAGVIGCQNTAGGEGIYVMFKGAPNIYHTAVYHRGRVVGSILEQSTSDGGASQVTIRIAPDYARYAGHHWAFYVENGRLTAGKLNSSGKSVEPGDRMCGFHSKTAFVWFKVKTLLSDRVSKAGRRAEKLHRRFTTSG